MRLIVAAAVVLVVLALCPYTPDAAIDIKYLILAWSALLLAIGWMAKHAVLGEPPAKPALPTYILFAFLALNATAALASSHRLNALHALTRLAALCILFLAVASAFRTKEQAWRLLAVMCIAVSMASIYGFLQKAGIDPFPWATREVEEYWGAPSTFGNPNLAAHALVLSMIMVAGLATHRGTRWCAALGCLILTHFLLTKERAGWVAVAAAATLVMAALLVRRYSRNPVRAAVAACVITAAVAAFAVIPVSMYVKHKTGSYFPLDGSLLLRYNANLGAARMILDRPLLGVGPGNYQIDSPPFWTPFEQHWFATQSKMNFHVHNDFLESATDGGLGALALYLGFLICLVLYALYIGIGYSDRDTRCLGLTLAACCCAFAVEGLFGFNSHVPVSGAYLAILGGLVQAQIAAPIGAAKPRRLAIFSAGGAVVAIAFLVAAIETSVFVAQFNFQRASGARAWGYPAVAYSYFERAERFMPWNWTIPLQKGALDAQSGQTERAIEEFERSLALNPNSLFSIMALANAFVMAAAADTGIEQGRDTGHPVVQAGLGRAELIAEQALRLCPELSSAHECLGGIWSLRALEKDKTGASADAGEAWLRAIGHLQQSLRIAPDDASRGRIQKKLAYAFLKVKDPEGAERALRASAESTPADDDIWGLFTTLASSYNRYDAMISAIHNAADRADRTAPERPELAMQLRLRLAAVSRKAHPEQPYADEVALGVLGAATGNLALWGKYASFLDPNLREEAIKAACARIKAEGKTIPDALETLVEALDGDKDTFPGAVKRLCDACTARADAGQAETLAQEYGWIMDMLNSRLAQIELPPEARATVLANIGLSILRCNLQEEAERLLAQAQPDLPAGHQVACFLQRSRICARLGHVDDALMLARQASGLAPTNPQVSWCLAQRLVAAKQVEAALAEYRLLLLNEDMDSKMKTQIQQEYDRVVAASSSAASGGSK